MQSRIRYLIYSQAYDGWLNKMADGITQDMFKSISFTNLEEAESWMQCIHAPIDKENYQIVETVTTIESKGVNI